MTDRKSGALQGKRRRWSGFALCVLCFAARGVRADEAATARRFEAAKRDEPSLIAFLKTMPKGGDLHNHVGGAVYAESALAAAIRGNLFFDPATSSFESQNGAGRVPAADLLSGKGGRYLSQFLDAASMRSVRPGDPSGHDHFFNTFGITGNAKDQLSLYEVNGESVTRARAQHIQYLELMTDVAPDAAYTEVSQDAPSVADPEKALETLKPRLDAFVTAARAFLDAEDRELAQKMGVPPPISGAQGPVTLRYIVSANRLASDEQFFVRLAAGMAVMRADKRVVGVNIVAPEDHPFAQSHFEAQMRLIDALWRHFGHPNITLHAGELTLNISPLEPMRSRIRRSVEVGHARRIGHGVSIAWEDDLPGLLNEMKRNGIAVEICLTSNDGILGVKGDRHPFNLYRRAGVPVNLNTDDEGVNRSNLTMEFVRAVRTYHLSYAEVKELVRNSLEYSFLPGASLYENRDYRRLRAPFAAIHNPNWQPSPAAQQLLNASDKMQVQVRLERAFVAFEK